MEDRIVGRILQRLTGQRDAESEESRRIRDPEPRGA